MIQGYRDRIKNPITAIRAFCVHCMGGHPNMVKDCTAPSCELFPLRMGVNTLSAKYGVALKKEDR